MRLGVLGARADRRGLATMTTEFCRHMQPSKVLGLEMPRARSDWSDYDADTLHVIQLRRMTDDVVREFLTGLDVCYLAETDYNPHRPSRRYVTAIAEEVGCKLVLHAMPELCRFAIGAPDRRHAERPPDLVVLPTPWMADRFPGAVVLPFPVNRTLLPFRQRTQARRFLHPVGKPAMDDRAGFDIASKVKMRAEVYLHTANQKLTDRAHYHDIYADFDVLVHPRRFGGQSLPLMEAASSGMPIVALDREPERNWLPQSCLVPVTAKRKRRMMGGDVSICDADPQALAAVLDNLASSPALVEELSQASDELAAGWSWEVLGPQWRELLESVCA